MRPDNSLPFMPHVEEVSEERSLARPPSPKSNDASLEVPSSPRLLPVPSPTLPMVSPIQPRTSFTPWPTPNLAPAQGAPPGAPRIPGIQDTDLDDRADSRESKNQPSEASELQAPGLHFVSSEMPSDSGRHWTTMSDLYRGSTHHRAQGIDGDGEGSFETIRAHLEGDLGALMESHHDTSAELPEQPQIQGPSAEQMDSSQGSPRNWQDPRISRGTADTLEFADLLQLPLSSSLDAPRDDGSITLGDGGPTAEEQLPTPEATQQAVIRPELSTASIDHDGSLALPHVGLPDARLNLDMPMDQSSAPSATAAKALSPLVGRDQHQERKTESPKSGDASGSEIRDKTSNVKGPASITNEGNLADDVPAPFQADTHTPPHARGESPNPGTQHDEPQSEPSSSLSHFWTQHGCFTPLGLIEEKWNDTVDVLALGVSCTRPTRAAKGPRDFSVTLQVTDPSMAPATTVVQIFRPHKEALPTLQAGDGLLLRGVKVCSLKRKIGLMSTVESAWVVFGSGPDSGVSSGPPVEFGAMEREKIGALQGWWDGLAERERPKGGREAAARA